MDLWYQLISHGVSSQEMDKKPTDQCKWKNSQTEIIAVLAHGSRES